MNSVNNATPVVRMYTKLIKMPTVVPPPVQKAKTVESGIVCFSHVGSRIKNSSGVVVFSGLTRRPNLTLDTTVESEIKNRVNEMTMSACYFP